MRIAWIYPFDKKKGNSFYAETYAAGLRDFCTVECVDIAECVRQGTREFERINSCDTVHIQYETTLFGIGPRSAYDRLVRAIKRPLAATVHEVYRDFPGVFPREQISGTGIIKIIKQAIYDIRHPVVTDYRRHIAEPFRASEIVVHYPYQKEILIEKGVAESLIAVIPYPLKEIAGQSAPGLSGFGSSAESVLKLCCSGFINRNYNYDLLFTALERLGVPWQFTWIGGLRRSEDGPQLEKVMDEIARRSWKDKFTITGWLPDEEMQKKLGENAIYLALFSNRSTSGTILDALSAHQLIVATDLPLMHELNAEIPVVTIVNHEPSEVSAAIEAIAGNGAVREQQLTNIRLFCKKHTYRAMAQKLFAVHENLFEKGRP